MKIINCRELEIIIPEVKIETAESGGYPGIIFDFDSNQHLFKKEQLLGLFLNDTEFLKSFNKTLGYNLSLNSDISEFQELDYSIDLTAYEDGECFSGFKLKAQTSKGYLEREAYFDYQSDIDFSLRRIKNLKFILDIDRIHWEY